MKKEHRIRISGLLLVGLMVLLIATACAADSQAADAGVDTLIDPVVDTVAGSAAGAATTARYSAGQTASTNSDAGQVHGQTADRPAISQTVYGTDVVEPTGGDLNDEEIADLLFMREEEKLARDVYLALYDLWGMPVFQNIAASEQTHTDAVKGLLDTYGLVDPVGDNAAGIFTNPDLQDLYNQLVADGSESLIDALKVGAAIEEIDILDLVESLARTDQPDITTVYENLKAGSENHLRAFVSTLERQTGEVYTPQYLLPADYEAIMSGSTGQGRGSGGGNSGGNNGGRGTGGQGNGRGRAG